MSKTTTTASRKLARHVRAEAVRPSHEAGAQLDLIAQATTTDTADTMHTVRSGRFMARVTGKNAGRVAKQLNAHTIRSGSARRVAELRRFPAFEPGMSTARYVNEYAALNVRHGGLPYDYATLNKASATLYEGGALDFEPVHEIDDATAAAVAPRPTTERTIGSHSGTWSARLYRDAASLPAVQFTCPDGAVEVWTYETTHQRAAALRDLINQAQDMAAGYVDPDQCEDNDDDTDPTPPAAPVASPADAAPTPANIEPAAVPKSESPQDLTSNSSLARFELAALRRAFVGPLAQRVADKSGRWEAFIVQRTSAQGKSSLSLAFFAGRAEKPTHYYRMRDRAHALQCLRQQAHLAEAMAARRAELAAQRREKLAKPHGLQVGDVLHSTWGYEQTNIDYYQVTAVIGVRTVEVRKIGCQSQETAYMSGVSVPAPGNFTGPVMRKKVDEYGQVNVLNASYGRAGRIEPVIVAGVKCYKASNWTSYA